MERRTRICVICGVRERHCREKLFFARFPLDENRCKIWVKVAGNEDLVHIPIEKLHDIKHVCEKHFVKRDFTKTGTRLKKRAVPKLNLTAAPLTEDQLASFPLHIAKETSHEQITASVDTKPKSKEEPLPSGSGVTRKVIESKLEKDLEQLTEKAESKAELLPSSSSDPKKRKLEKDLVEITLCEQKSTAVAIDHSYAAPQTEIAHTTRKMLTTEPVPSGQAEPLMTTHVTKEQKACSTGLKRKLDEYFAQTTTPCEQALTAVATDHSYAAPQTEIDHTNPKILTTEPVTSGQAETLMTSEQKVCPTGVKRKLDENLDITPRKKKLMAQLKKTKCTLASLKKSAKLIENLSSPVLKDFVMSAIKNQKRKPQGKRWTTKNKISALAIFKRSPKAYRYLQHVMPLPSTKTLQNILKNIPMEPGINSAVINILKKNASTAKEKDKYCVLTFDEMAIKRRLVYNEATDKVEGFVDFGGDDGRTGELADHCLVFQLQGIHRKFKQPLSFYFLKGTVSSQKLAVLIKENIEAITKSGYRVIGTVCDQGPTNMGALKLLRQWHNGGENFFIYNEEKVYNICDVPHLLKSIRNNFMKNGIINMDNKTGKWAHILEVEQQNRNFLYMSKISTTHVMPKYRAKMKVKYAAQIFSQTVAAILKLLSKSRDSQFNGAEMLQTAHIVEDINRLFDFTNGPSNPDDVRKGIRENVSLKTDHLRVWAEFTRKLATVKFLSNGGREAKNVRCIDGYITTLKSFRDIWNDVKEKGFKYLNLRQLNQDALENLFGIIRQHSPTNRNPTCSSLMAALKTSVISGMTAPHSRGANCEKDDKNLLTNFHDLVFPEKQDHEVTKNIPGPSLLEAMPGSSLLEVMPGPSHQESPDLSPPTLSLLEDYIDDEVETDLTEIKEQPVVYVSGYIASVILKKYKNCNHCKKCLTVAEQEAEGNPIYELIKLKEWWKDRVCLTYPSTDLCKTVEKALHIFENEIIPVFSRINLGQWVVTAFYINCNVSWVCTEHSRDLIKDMFTRLSLLFIRRQCQKVNYSLAQKEEDLADARKKGEQYGVSK